MSCETSFSQFCRHVGASDDSVVLALGNGQAELAVAVLAEIFDIARARADREAPAPADQLGDLRARASAARAEEDCLRLFGEIAQANLPPPAHGEASSGRAYPLPRTDALIAYAEVMSTIDAARAGRRLPDLARQIVTAQAERAATQAYAPAALAAIGRNPEIINVANDGRDFSNIRGPIKLARQITQTPDVPAHLRKAAEQLVGTARWSNGREAQSIAFARALCHTAGVVRCPVCGRFEGQAPHTCPIPQQIAALPALAHWASPENVEQIPDLEELGPAELAALDAIAEPMAVGPGPDHLHDLALAYREWRHFMQASGRPGGFVHTRLVSATRPFLRRLAVHLCATVAGAPVPTPLPPIAPDDRARALIARAVAAVGNQYRMFSFEAALRQFPPGVTPEVWVVAIDTFLAHHGDNGDYVAAMLSRFPTSLATHVRAQVTAVLARIESHPTVLHERRLLTEALARFEERVAADTAAGTAAAAETVLGYWRAEGGPEGGPRRTEPGPLQPEDLDRLRASPTGKALLTLLCNQAAKESGEGTEQTRSFYRIKPALLADAIADLGPDNWGYTYHEQGQRGRLVVYLHTDIGSIPFHVEGSESELQSALQSKQPDSTLRWSRIVFQSQAGSFARGWLDSRLTTGQGQGWDALRQAATLSAVGRVVATVHALRAVAPELNAVECHQALVTLRRLGEPALTRGSEVAVVRRLSQLGEYRGALNLARAQTRADDRQALLLGLEDTLPPAAGWSPAQRGDHIVTTHTPDAHREHVAPAQTPGRVVAFDGPYVLVAFALPLTTAQGQHLESTPERPELVVRYLPDEISLPSAGRIGA